MIGYIIGFMINIMYMNSCSSTTTTEDTNTTTGRGDDVCPDKNSGMILDTIYFQTKSDVLTEESKKTLENIYNRLKGNRRLKVRLEVHSDSADANNVNRKFNRKLEKERGTVTKKYLKDLGIRGKLLSVVSFGDNCPEFQDDESFKNNRVTIRALYRTDS